MNACDVTRPEDVAGFCKSATLAEIASHDFVLTPGRYVGAEEVEEDAEPFGAKMKRPSRSRPSARRTTVRG
jgi:type I restriction enzyme M protein